MRPPRPPKPLEREDFDKAVTAMFRKGDTNRDGTVTIAELQAVIQTRRSEVIEARFKRIDRDGNGAISRVEFQAWQGQLGTAALSEDQAFVRDGALVPATIEPDLDDDAEAMVMRRLIEPLSATMLVRVNTNYDGGASLAELLAYEGARFEQADTDGDGSISMFEARPEGPGRGGPPGGVPAGPPPGRPD